MTKAQLEKKYEVQIDTDRSMSTWKRTGFIAYSEDTVVAQGKTLADIANQLKQRQ